MANTFEENLKELEEVVSSLEKGIKLSKECNKKLDEAEKKINILVEKEGTLSEETFEE